MVCHPAYLCLGNFSARRTIGEGTAPALVARPITLGDRIGPISQIRSEIAVRMRETGRRNRVNESPIVPMDGICLL